MEKINWRSFLLIWFFSVIVFAGLSTLSSYLASDLYSFAPQIWREFSGIWALGIILYYILFPLIFAFGYVLFFMGIPSKGITKGIVYGSVVFLLLGIKVVLVTYCSTIIPLNLILMWLGGSFVNIFALSVICGLIYQPK